MRVLGVDGCRAGWLGIVLDDGHPEAVFAPMIADLVTNVGPVEGISIDIPIGLLDHGRRTADVAARARIGKLGPSVFSTPARSALSAKPFAAAVAESVRQSGTGISQQAYALRTKIFEVEEWLPTSTSPVWEVHPEVSFAVAGGAMLSHSKRTWAGVGERRLILANQGLAIEGPMLPGGTHAGVDDILDAAIAAWSARRLVAGIGESFPSHPDQFSLAGRPIAIWA
jgi:predicted RNase H-like nuclease